MSDTELKQEYFDFDHWMKLAKEDPQAFESARQAKVEEFIASQQAFAQERLRRLQWRIEMERQRASNPMDAAIRIYDMMWESMGSNFEALERLAISLDDSRGEVPAMPEAKVLPFQKQAATLA